MLAFLISAIEWAKLIVGLSLVIAGCILFIRPCGGMMVTTAMSLNMAMTYALLLGTGLATIVTGFYIASW